MKETLVGIISFLAVIVLTLVFFTSSGYFTAFTIKTVNENTLPYQTTLTGQVIAETSAPRWSSLPITYRIQNPTICGTHETKRIIAAFRKIQEVSEITFEPILDRADIEIKCTTEPAPSDQNSNGLDRTARTYLSVSGREIKEATIIFYNTNENRIASNCASFPDVEIHEILHALALEHNEEENNILNPIQSYCPTKINEDIIQQLNSLYL